MSRTTRLVHGVSSGYAVLAANTAFTLASIPLALRYLSKEEFGIWALVTQVVGYLALVDLGLSGAIMRTLIDHKDQPSGGVYGAVIKTGLLVLVVQGLLIGVLSWLLGYWGAELMKLPSAYVAQFRLLLLAHGIVTGALFVFRMSAGLLQAHQRYDVVNYSGAIAASVNLVGLWAGLHMGLGLFSLLVGYAASAVLSAVLQTLAVARLHLLPPPQARGRPSLALFKELFCFGGDLFLLSVGLQLLNASQTIIITRTLGLEANTVWSVATKVFVLGQQLVWRLWDFSIGALAEMFVRQERARLEHRFKQIFLLTASVSVWIAATIMVCNESFLAIWTGGRVKWHVSNDVLMAILFVTTSVTRLHIGLLGPTKKIGRMRYVYLLEGVLFVCTAFLLTSVWGFAAVILPAIVMNVLCSGAYGTFRTAAEFQVFPRQVAINWLAPAFRLVVVLAPLALVCWWAARSLPPTARFITGGLVLAIIGLPLFWKLGLTAEMREEFAGRLRSLRLRGRRQSSVAP